MTVLRPSPHPRPLDSDAVPGVQWRTGNGAEPAATAVTGITNDSRAIQPGDIYAALPGARVHGIQFAEQAVAAGAVAILTDSATQEQALALGVPVAAADAPRDVLGELSAWVYGHPGDDLLLIGITGTNGKTTCSYLVEGGLSAAGHRTGIIGTTGIWIDDQVVPSARTTPEAPDVHALLAVMRERGVTAAVMEVSSHALAMGRVDGLRFDVAMFTNLTQDHLDFHATMAEYFATKADLFTQRRARAAVVCVDDEWGATLAQQIELPSQTYGLGIGRAGAGSPSRVDAVRDWTAWRVEPTQNGHLAISVAGPDGTTLRLESPLPGLFNAANAVGAFVTLRSAGISEEHARHGLLLARAVPGRMERVGAGTAGFPAFVDYAHTPDAVERVIRAARDLTTGSVLVVLGAGGDRDRDKRPQMGEIAATRADRVFVTDDNPRSEVPAAIRADILAGVPDRFRSRVAEVGDRREAIEQAAQAARPGDVLLVLGKGHEQGQDIGGTIYPFDDRVELLQALRAPGVARLDRS